MRRIVDLVAGGLGALLRAAVGAVVAGVIRCRSGSPVLFRSGCRVGRLGVRSRHPFAQLWLGADPTRVGARTSDIDEGMGVVVALVQASADVADDAKLGEGTSVWHLAQVREGAVLGNNCSVGRGACVGAGVRLGDSCKLQNYSMVYEPAVLEDGVSVGPGVVLTNDQYPRSASPEVGSRMRRPRWIPRRPAQLDLRRPGDVRQRCGTTAGAGVDARRRRPEVDGHPADDRRRGNDVANRPYRDLDEALSDGLVTPEGRAVNCHTKTWGTPRC